MENLESVMYHLVENLRKIAIMLKPVMESTEEKILSELGIKDEKLKTWESLEKNDLLKEDIKVIEKGEPLFVRLDKDEEIEAIKEEMKK